MTVLSFTEVPCYFKIDHRLDNNHEWSVSEDLKHDIFQR